MDFIDYAKIIVSELTEMPLTVYDRDTAFLEEFEKSYCFLPAAQPLFTAKNLLAFFSQKDGSRIYMIVDALDIHSVIIKANARWVIIGPYTVKPWQDGAARSQLVKCGAQEAILYSYKVYYCKLPLLSDDDATRIATMILSHTVDANRIFEKEAVDVAASQEALRKESVAFVYENNEIVNLRNSVRAQLQEAIRKGDDKRAIESIREFESLATGLRFISNSVNDMIVLAGGIRMTVWEAALQSGLSPVFVDALSQEYAQRMHLAKSKAELRNLITDYISDFCRCIRKYQDGNYSSYIRQSMQYIDTHLSQPVTVEELSCLCGVTQKYLAHLFKKETGKTIGQYIMQIRCERAAQLLQDSNLQIQEIGRYVGYSDNNYFTKVFKQVMGITPQEYRKGNNFYR